MAMQDFLTGMGLSLAALLLAWLLAGFWRGLSLKPHEPDRRAPPPPSWP
jgi:hypothetical protein